MDIDRAVDAIKQEMNRPWVEYGGMVSAIRRGLEKTIAAEQAPPAKVEAGTKVAYRGGSVNSSLEVIAVYARGTVAVEYAGGPTFLERADAFRVLTPATIEPGDTVLHAEHGVGLVRKSIEIDLGPVVMWGVIPQNASRTTDMIDLDRANLTILMKAPKE